MATGPYNFIIFHKTVAISFVFSYIMVFTFRLFFILLNIGLSDAFINFEMQTAMVLACLVGLFLLHKKIKYIFPIQFPGDVCWFSQLERLMERTTLVVRVEPV